MKTLSRNAVAWALALLICGAGCRHDEASEAGKSDQATRSGETGGSAPRVEPPASTPRVEPPARPVETPVTLAAGTTLTGTLQNSLASNKSTVGQPVSLSITQPVVANGERVVPAGSTVQGKVTHVNSAGRIKGAAELTVHFDTLVLPNGKQRTISVEPVSWRIKGDGKESAAEISGGAAVGGIVGGVTGGTNGAIAGGAIGAVLGTGVAVVTKGQQIELPAGYGLSLRLAAPLSMGALPG